MTSLFRLASYNIQKKITDPNGVLALMLKEKRPAREIVDELYLRTLSRLPGEQEKHAATQALLRAASEQQGLEDTFWALLNSKEFLYNH